jgi:hypothetical protein
MNKINIKITKIKSLFTSHHLTFRGSDQPPFSDKLLQDYFYYFLKAISIIEELDNLGKTVLVQLTLKRSYFEELPR